MAETHVPSRAIADGHAAFHSDQPPASAILESQGVAGRTYPTTDIRIFIPSIDILILSRYRLSRPVLVDTGNRRHHGSQGHLLSLGGYELDAALYRKRDWERGC